MSDETSERYVMEINSDHTVSVIDTVTDETVSVFVSADRLLRATEQCAALNRRDAAGAEPAPEAEPVTPRSFLAESLPAFARNQRRDFTAPVWHAFVTSEAETAQPAQAFSADVEIEIAESSQRAQEAWSQSLRDAGGQIDTMMGIKPAPHATRAQRLEAMLAEVKTAESRTLALLAEDARLLNRAASLRKRLETALSATQSAEKAARVGEDAESVLKSLRDVGPALSKPGPY